LQSSQAVRARVSRACDLRVTELVDGNVAVHVMVAKTLPSGGG
jgi:hypothetical protein